MNLINYTEHSAETALVYDQHGRVLLVVVAKVSRQLDNPEKVHDKPLPIHMADVHYDSGALKYPADIHSAHRGTSVVCLGHVYGPHGRATYEAQAEVRVGNLYSAITARGARHVERRFGRLVPSEPEPFMRMPIRFENSLGGPTNVTNPVGIGELKDISASKQEGSPLPTIEWAGTQPSDSRGRAFPAGFSPIARGWQPRCLFAGTYDDVWRRHRAPLLPLDFDERFNVVANAGLWSAEPMRGAEPIELKGLLTQGRLVTRIPRVALSFHIGNCWHRPQIDLVLLEPDENRVSLSYRVSADMTNCIDRLPKVRIIQKRLISTVIEDQ